MPRRIETKTKMHLVQEELGLSAERNSQIARTRCGQTVAGQLGYSIIDMIDCKTCRKIARNRGWRV